MGLFVRRSCSCQPLEQPVYRAVLGVAPGKVGVIQSQVEHRCLDGLVPHVQGEGSEIHSRSEHQEGGCPPDLVGMDVDSRGLAESLEEHNDPIFSHRSHLAEPKGILCLALPHPHPSRHGPEGVLVPILTNRSLSSSQ